MGELIFRIQQSALGIQPARLFGLKGAVSWPWLGFEPIQPRIHTNEHDSESRQQHSIVDMVGSPTLRKERERWVP
jgi:hypothetical protein